jgi:hypothetical protein
MINRVVMGVHSRCCTPIVALASNPETFVRYVM